MNIVEKQIKINKLKKIRDKKKFKLVKTEDEEKHLKDKKMHSEKRRERDQLEIEYKKKLTSICRIRADIRRIEEEIIELEKGIL